MELLAAGGLALGRETPVDAARVTNVCALVTTGLSVFTYDYPTTRIDVGVLVFPSLDDPWRVRINTNVKLKREVLKDFFVSLTGYDAFDSRPKSSAATQYDFGVSLSWFDVLAGTREVFVGTERERAGLAKHAARAQTASVGAALRAQRRNPLRKLLARAAARPA